MRISAESDRCVAAGQCYLAAPDVFDQSDDGGVVIVLQPEPPREALESVREAVRACPARALTLQD